MKLVFPHKEHKDFELIGESFTIGSSDDATIKIDAIGMNAVHATLIKDDKDYALKIDNPACMASVNGRLVKEIKEVREGDLMIIAQVHCKLIGKTEVKEDDNRTRIRMALPKFVLRGVSGVYFGKTFPLRGKTSLGRHSDNDIFVNVDGISRKHAVISVMADGLEIEDLDSSNGTYVNGKQINKANINIGDEIKLDNIRFLIQSPGMQLDKNTQKFQSKKIPANNSNVGQSHKLAEPSGAAAKWLLTLIILLLAGATGAWYMGFLDKFLN
jgi:pSer/pThr/pTyr-binding forkhead associated (FHA) protein